MAKLVLEYSPIPRINLEKFAPILIQNVSHAELLHEFRADMVFKRNRCE